MAIITRQSFLARDAAFSGPSQSTTANATFLAGDGPEPFLQANERNDFNESGFRFGTEFRTNMGAAFNFMEPQAPATVLFPKQGTNPAKDHMASVFPGRANDTAGPTENLRLDTLSLLGDLGQSVRKESPPDQAAAFHEAATKVIGERLPEFPEPVRTSAAEEFAARRDDLAREAAFEERFALRRDQVNAYVEQGDKIIVLTGSDPVGSGHERRRFLDAIDKDSELTERTRSVLKAHMGQKLLFAQYEALEAADPEAALEEVTLALGRAGQRSQPGLGREGTGTTASLNPPAPRDGGARLDLQDLAPEQLHFLKARAQGAVARDRLDSQVRRHEELSSLISEGKARFADIGTADLPPDVKAGLNRRLTIALQEIEDARTAVERYAEPDRTFDPDNAEDRKLVADAVHGLNIDLEAAASGDQKELAALTAVINRTRILPDNARHVFEALDARGVANAAGYLELGRARTEAASTDPLAQIVNRTGKSDRRKTLSSDERTFAAFGITESDRDRLNRETTDTELAQWLKLLKAVNSAGNSRPAYARELRARLGQEFLDRPQTRSLLNGWLTRLIQNKARLVDTNPDTLPPDMVDRIRADRGVAESTVDIVTDFIPGVDQVKAGYQVFKAAQALDTAFESGDDAAIHAAGVVLATELAGFLPGPNVIKMGRRLQTYIDRLRVSQSLKDRFRRLINQSDNADETGGGAGRRGDSDVSDGESANRDTNHADSDSGPDRANETDPPGPDDGGRPTERHRETKNEKVDRLRGSTEIPTGNRQASVEYNPPEKIPDVDPEDIRPLPRWSEIDEAGILTKEKFNADFPSAGEIDPNIIGTTQKGISPEVGLPLTVQKRETDILPLDRYVAALQSGRLKPENIEPINLYVLDGRIVSSDHRRLVAARLAGVKVRYRIITSGKLSETLKRKVDEGTPNHRIEIRIPKERNNGRRK